MNIFDTLMKLKPDQKVNQRKPMRIYKDENGQIIEEPLLKDMTASALINETMKQYNTKNPAKEIHKFMFGY